MAKHTGTNLLCRSVILGTCSSVPAHTLQADCTLITAEKEGETASFRKLSWLCDNCSFLARRSRLMPLVCSEWAHALAGHSFAWEQMELRHPPHDWSKLTSWAAAHCKHTQQLTLEDLDSESKDALPVLLSSGFLALRSIKLTGSVSSTPMLWSHLLTHRLHHLHLELASISEADIAGVSLMQGLQQLSLQVSKPSHADAIHLPGCLTSLANLTSLSLRNISAAQGVVSDSFTLLKGLQDLTFVRARITQFNFSFDSLPRLSSLLLSEDHRSGQVLSLPGLSELTSLKRLSVSSGLEAFPEDVLGVNSVTSLDLGWNRFRMLPNGPYLRNLRELQFQERPSVIDLNVLDKAAQLSLLSFDVTYMSYKDIIALLLNLISRLSNLNRIVLLKASYNGAADREDQIAQSFLQLVNALGHSLSFRKAVQIELEHKWRPLLWSDVSR